MLHAVRYNAEADEGKKNILIFFFSFLSNSFIVITRPSVISIFIVFLCRLSLLLVSFFSFGPLQFHAFIPKLAAVSAPRHFWGIVMFSVKHSI